MSHQAVNSPTSGDGPPPRWTSPHRQVGTAWNQVRDADGLASKNKVNRHDSQRTKDELEYIAKRVHDIDQLIITDLNFGMYKQDLSTAKEIFNIQKVYNFPKNIGAAAGKNKPKRTIEVASILKGWSPGASIQSSDPEVLKSIKRQNINRL